MNQKQILENTQNWIKNEFWGEASGHDFFHVQRVVNNALKIGETEKADLFLVELAAWLHDVGDYKLNNGIDQSEQMITAFLKTQKLEQAIIEKILEIGSQVSFSKGNKATSIEAQIVQDADRLDALGAIGISRCFAYGGKSGREIWNPEKPETTSIQHFYDKLLKLKDLMNTVSARKMAEERHLFLKDFLNKFYNEWEAKA